MRKNWHVASVSVMVTLAAISCAKRASHAPRPPPPPSIEAAAKVIASDVTGDETLWNYVYAGDPRRFSRPKDRLHVLNPCITVTGRSCTRELKKTGTSMSPLTLTRRSSISSTRRMHQASTGFLLWSLFVKIP